MLDRVQQDALKVVARELRLLREERVCKLQLALRGDGEDLERRGAAAAAAAAEQARLALLARAQDVDGRSGGMLSAAGESTEDGRKGRGSGSQEELSPENGQREIGCDGRESLLGDAGAGWEGGREGGGSNIFFVFYRRFRVGERREEDRPFPSCFIGVSPGKKHRFP